MRIRLKTMLMGLVLSLLLVPGGTPLPQPRLVKAQQSETPFLITPYYGSEAIKAYFDHEYPTNSSSPNNNNAIFTRYDGARWTNVPKANCSEYTGNCYDGHSGVDFGLSY